MCTDTPLPRLAPQNIRSQRQVAPWCSVYDTVPLEPYAKVRSVSKRANRETTLVPNAVNVIRGTRVASHTIMPAPVPVLVTLGIIRCCYTEWSLKLGDQNLSTLSKI